MENKWIMTEYGKMLSSYSSCKLSDVCVGKTGIQTGPFGSQLHKEDYVEVGTPIITVEHLGQNRIQGNNYPLVSNEDKKRLIKFQLETGDIVFSRVGSVDRRSIVRETENGWLFSGRCLRVRVNEEIIDPSFLSQFFGFEYFKEYIRSIAVGATMPSINTKILSELPIYYPTLSEQKRIAHILGSLDDKIELNRQMNQTLEKIAQALFKSWFVDFDPVIDNALTAGKLIPEELQAKAEKRKALGKDKKPLPEEIQKLFPNEFEFSEELEKWVPLGWQSVKFDSIAEVKYGKDHKKLEEGNIPVYGSGGLMRYVNQSLYNGESVLIPRKGTLSNLMYVNEEFWSVDTMFFTKLKLENHAKYLYYNLKLLDFNEMNVGSAVPSMTTKVLSSLNFILPPKNLVKVFDDYIQNFYSKIEANTKQINKLTKTRDTLLPKLISGEVRV